MVIKWIQKALKKHKVGSLHKQLEIRKSKKIPKSLLEKISKTKIENIVKFQNKKIKVTLLLKQRAVMALNLRK